jgi:nucleoside-diphosphate-sugar epimerase
VSTHDSDGGRVLFVGGTRFVGRHGVEAFHEAGYEVTVFSRGRSGNPFAGRDGIHHVQGDRTEQSDLERARAAAASAGPGDSTDATSTTDTETVGTDTDGAPDIVIDTCAYHPRAVRTAVDVFADSRYVYVSSGSAYAPDDAIPMREDETPLEPCDEEAETDDSPETYGARKAEGDRVVFDAAADGVEAMSVRPMLVVGPHDYTERFGYWVGRVAAYDRVLVPGDGGSLLHRTYVRDLADALVTVAEEGDPGEAYNVADRTAYTLDRSLEIAADGLDTDVEIVHASARELAAHDVTPEQFPLYAPVPALAATEKLAALGWDSTDPEEAVAETARRNYEADLTDPEGALDRATEERVLDELAD